MPLPPQIQLSNTFGHWVNTTNQIITATGNSSEYILVAQNATPQTSSGNVSVNGTITVVNLTANGIISGNGVSLSSLNASALATGTVPLGQLSSANTTANGVVDTTTQSFAGNKTFTNNVEILGYLTVGNNTITLNSTTLVLGNSLSNLVFTSAGVTKDGTTIIDSSGVSNNALNLNGQPASYYTNASNLSTGTLAIARLDANVLLTTSTTGINASALSTGTVPDGRLTGAYTGISSLALGANTVVNTSTVFVGNSTANVVHTATQVSVANSTSTTTLTPTTLTIGSTTLNAISYTGNVTGTASNATNLNSQPASYYTNASNLSTGTLAIARLDANVILTTSTTGMNASALSTGTVPLARLTSANTSASGVIDTTTQSFAGDKTFTNNVTVSGTITGNVTGTASNATNLNSQPGSYYTNASNLATGTVPLGRLSSANTVANGVVDTTTQSFAGDKTFTNNVTVSGTITGNVTGTSSNATNLNSQPGSYYTNASNLSTGTVPLARLSSANTVANGVVDTTTQSFAGDKTFTNNVTVSGTITGNLTGNVTGTASNATNLNSQPASYYTNASNLATGTVPLARLTSANTVANGVVDTTTQSFAGDKTFTNNVTVSGTITGNVSGTVSNATNLNSQPGSYYTNASNLSTGTVAIARLDANVILTTSTTGINASALSTGTVPVERLSAANTSSNGVITTTTQSFAGNKTFNSDVTITGNLTIIGTETTLNVNNVIVTDSLIQLAANNLTSDALDIGLYGNYNGDGGAHEHSGLFRDASDGVWKLFVGLQDNPTTTINTAGTGYAVGTLVSYLNSGILTTNTTQFNVTANSSYSGTLTVNTVTAATFTGNLSGTASNATNLNNQPGSYYTNASNLATGTVPLARLDANVLLTTSTTGINASALSTGTVPLGRLTSANTSANGVVDTTTQSFAGDKTFTNNVTVSGTITGNVTGTVTNATNLNSQPASYYTNASNLATGTVPLARLDANVILTTSTTGINASALSIGTVPDARLAGAYTNVTAISLGANVVANVTTVFVGNSTANATHTATAFAVANSTNTATLTPISLTIGSQVTNTSGFYAGANIALTTSSLVVGNTTVNSAYSATQLSVANSTSTATLTPTTLTIGSTTLNAISYTGNVTGTASNATNLNSQPASYYTNASNLATGTVPLARLTSANTSANGVIDTTTQSFAGNKTFQNTVSFSSTVSITGAANALSTLGVGGTFTALGTSTLTGAATLSNTASITGAVNALSTLGVSGAFSALSTSAHTGAATFSSTISVTGTATMNGIIDANNKVTLNTTNGRLVLPVGVDKWAT